MDPGRWGGWGPRQVGWVSGVPGRWGGWGSRQVGWVGFPAGGVWDMDPGRWGGGGGDPRRWGGGSGVVVGPRQVVSIFQSIVS